MNKQELIKRISELPYSEGPIADTVTVNRNWILGSIEQLDEPQKVTVPQFVADLIEYAKKNDWDLDDTFQEIADSDGSSDVYRWYYSSSDNMDTFARAWLDGYTVEEKRYTVKIKAVDQYLVSAKDENFLGFLTSKLRTYFTRKELEEAGFGEVFDSPLFEVEEVEE